MEIAKLDDRFQNIKKAWRNSEDCLSRLQEVGSSFAKSGVFLCVNGSLARKELAGGSDFDAFPVRNRESNDVTSKLWSAAYDRAGLKTPGSSGVFGAGSVVIAEDMLSNIGGNNDTNEKITQRMLLVLESTCIGDADAFSELCDRIIERYISDKITDHQLSLFLLNDIIRYYRTVCVDFEFKTEEDNKPWGIRNIKLVFSRKIVYFSGLLLCAETVQRTAIQKRALCRRYMMMTPIERLLSILGESAFEPLIYYDAFLEKMADPSVRSELEDNDREKLRTVELFRSLKNDGHHFSMSLRASFMRHYDGTHPIHRALIF